MNGNVNFFNSVENHFTNNNQKKVIRMINYIKGTHGCWLLGRLKTFFVGFRFEFKIIFRSFTIIITFIIISKTISLN